MTTTHPLHDKLATLPTSPGVYLFKDSKGRTVYVGKAKNVRNRVRSHLSGKVHAPKQEAMLQEAVEVDVIVTDTDLEALALENSLIKQNRPRFNVQLRDDKTYPYLRLTIGERFPRLMYVRGVKKDGSRYFGPYAPASTAHNTQRLIYRNFGLRPCNIDIDGSWDRPCLYYDIGECAGPCVADLCSEERYAEVAEESLKFLAGKGEDLRADLEAKMASAAAGQQYELAAHYRDLLETVLLTAREQKVATTGLDDRDFFALHRRDEKLAAPSTVKTALERRRQRAIEMDRLGLALAQVFSEFDGSDNEIIHNADHLGISASTVRTRVQKARLILAETLIRQGFEI